jgi:hypothetical protein
MGLGLMRLSLAKLRRMTLIYEVRSQSEISIVAKGI